MSVNTDQCAYEWPMYLLQLQYVLKLIAFLFLCIFISFQPFVMSSANRDYVHVDRLLVKREGKKHKKVRNKTSKGTGKRLNSLYRMTSPTELLALPNGWYINPCVKKEARCKAYRLPHWAVLGIKK